MTIDEGRLKILAQSYIDHLLLILGVDDGGANLRDFLDPWWSLERGSIFVKKTRSNHVAQHTLNNPCPIEHGSRLPKLDWVSTGARAALERSLSKKSRSKTDYDNVLVVDHAVPISQIRRELFRDREQWNHESLRKFLRHHYRRALLTKSEDSLLNEKVDGRSLRAEMPQDWRTWGHPFARYSARGISGVENPLTD